MIVDTTVQPKAVAFPTDAKLMHRARERLVRLARKHGVDLRQSYERVGKHALIAHQRYAHAKQFKRANRALRKIRTYLGRVIRDIVRKIKGDAALAERLRPIRCRWPAGCASSASISADTKVYSLHAPEVECIGKGKAHSPLRVRRQGLASPRRSIAPRAASSSPTPRRCPATPMTATRWRQ